MADNKDKGPLIPISMVAVMLAALGVTMFVQPFKGGRPFVSEYRESYQQVSARLWQDPFQAVLDSMKEDQAPESAGQLEIVDGGRNGQKEKPFASRYLKAIEGKNKVTVLAVMVPGGPYFEGTESRMRYRYALLSGLKRVGFVSEDAEHVEFIRIGFLDKKITLSNIMPIEWLAHEKDKKDEVLVLWINDDVFGGTPLSKLARVIDYIKKASELRSIKVTVQVIGPAISGTLKEMVQEVSSDKAASPIKSLEHVQIYSSVATVDNARLLNDAESERVSESVARDEIRKRFEKHKIELIRTIGTDKALVDTLIEELNRRRVDLRAGKNHLLLVAEWDTFYGRSFKTLFNESLKKALKDKGVADDEIDRRIHFISYLRGIDGSVPGEKGDKDKKDGNTEAKSDPLSDVKKLEQPVGKSQYDYLRRLADATYDLNEKLRANGSNEEIRAIGVMGSDFYDKYLVLQALRQRFPDPIFFTTDLDARFLHPDNIKWTRNLVVASNFNLSLRRDDVIDLQGEAPPFRDNYQTSMFLTVLQAFKDKWSNLNKDAKAFLEKLDKEKPNETRSRPLIFEIGRHKAAGLTDTVDTVHPQREQTADGIWFYGRIALIIASGLMVIFWTSTGVNNFVKQLFHAEAKYKMVAVAGVLFLAGCGWAVSEISRRPDEEPFSVLEGISVWPTEILRFVAFLLSVLFLYLSWRSREENRERIDKEFAFKVEPDRSLQDNDAKTGHEERTRSWRHIVTELDWEPGGTKQGTKLRDVWVDYVSRDLDRYRIVRVAIVLVFFALFCGLIVSFDMPVSPVRGPISSGIDKAASFLSSVFLVVLILYVFDVTRCCGKFINRASGEITAPHQSGEEIRDQVKNQLDLIRLIAMRTDTIGRLIFYPFIVWFLMFVARFDYFDNWKTPPELMVVISLWAVLAWSCAFLLRQSAERARTCAADRLKDLLLSAMAAKDPSPDMIKQIEFVLDEVRSIRQGAFLPFTQHPVLQSLLVPFGGVGGIYFIDFLTKMSF